MLAAASPMTPDAGYSRNRDHRGVIEFMGAQKHLEFES